MMEQLEEYPREPLDTDSIFAKFGRKILSDYEVMALSMASMVCNPFVPASDIYLTYVSHCDCYVDSIRQFCLGIARQLAVARKPTARGTYPYLPSYDERWGKYAVSDAMVIAILGKDKASPLDGPVGRCVQFGVDTKTYRKVRDFVAGVLTLTIMDYREALEWAMGKRRDTVLQARWGRRTGQSFPTGGVRAIMESAGSDTLPSAIGCHIRPAVGDEQKTSADTFNAGFRHDELWRP